jgi:hypothetical protein
MPLAAGIVRTYIPAGASSPPRHSSGFDLSSRAWPAQISGTSGRIISHA